MPPIRVLVVDDSVVVRRLVSDVLAADAELEVAGTAANGRLALAKLDQLQPDVVTLDVEMPELDGLQTLVELRKRRPLLPVIMFSTLTERGATATLDALALGANDYVTKPANVGSVTNAQQRIREELIPKIKGLCRRSAPDAAPPSARQAVVLRSPTRGPSEPIELVAVGVSTGGPNALAALVSKLPADFPKPIVVVQHMPPLFTRFLAERLASQASLPVVEAGDGETLTGGGVWIAPGDHHLEVVREGFTLRTRLHQGPPENFCRPAVDVLFRSAARCLGPRSLGVILTGMGQDGLLGSREIVENGGRVLAQDEATSVVWGMPGFVARLGLANRVLPIGDMAGEIVAQVKARTVSAAPRGLNAGAI